MILLATLRVQLKEYKNILDLGMIIICVGEIFLIVQIIKLYLKS